MALLEVFLLTSCFLAAGVYSYSLENDVPVRPLVLRDDEMRVLRTLRFYDLLQKRDSECSVPSEKDVNNGKHCPPENGIAGCLNGNKGYTSLAAAWEACGKVTGCGFIMRYSNGNFYLRRLSDPDGAGAGLWGYTYKPCPPAQEKCEDKFDRERCSQLVLTNGVDGKCGDSSALKKRCCAYCKAEEEKEKEEKCEDTFSKCYALVKTNGVDGKCGDKERLWEKCCAYCKAEKDMAAKDMPFYQIPTRVNDVRY